ncbi:hypothetical protein BD309DRAFT_987168 [Dichomitus squalens]|uniref:Uncharacterized protein n=1 Tax=Dichomitus squalens TaxID=114155 RepID=A0A4Q9P2U1_9APHY|nr:hypothetical protein BD309DRAFT_987168 [Dichomitus squalens]TBU59708.1 hypothetical protein BD310DRAFT_976419 [Dichomitus squalens]
MASIFQLVCCCCARGGPSGQNEPDEHTPLFQPSDDSPPARNYTVDHQKMKERLGHIVRSKEGKMVNVNQPLPFNLHNRPTYGRPDRSVSTNTTPPRPTSSTSQNNPSPDSPSVSTFQKQPTVPPYVPSRDPSPSIQTSRSTSSLHPGDASYLPPEADPDGGFRRAILNVRLVRGPGGFTPGGRARQGRSVTRGRLGRFGEHSGESAEDVNGKGKQVENSRDGIEVESPSPAEEGSQNRNLGQPHQLGNGGQAAGRGSPDAVPDRRAPFLATEFKIEDVGSLSQSWGE